MRKFFLVLSSLVIILTFNRCSWIKKEPQWTIKATYHEGCSCNAPCPCPFGLPMTNSFCKLNSLLDIHEGRFEQVDLSGIKVIMSGSAGKWGEYYFPESVSDEQKKSIEKILKTVNVTGFDTILISKRTKINHSTKNGKVIYSTSNMYVEMNMVKGANDQPVIVQNLSRKAFKNYIPHLAKRNDHFSSDSNYHFSFKDKAGFTSEWNLTSNDFEGL